MSLFSRSRRTRRNWRVISDGAGARWRRSFFHQPFSQSKIPSNRERKQLYTLFGSCDGHKLYTMDTRVRLLCPRPSASCSVLFSKIIFGGRGVKAECHTTWRRQVSSRFFISLFLSFIVYRRFPPFEFRISSLFFALLILERCLCFVCLC